MEAIKDDQFLSHIMVKVYRIKAKDLEFFIDEI